MKSDKEHRGQNKTKHPQRGNYLIVVEYPVKQLFGVTHTLCPNTSIWKISKKSSITVLLRVRWATFKAAL